MRLRDVGARCCSKSPAIPFKPNHPTHCVHLQVPSGQLFLRPVQKEVDAKCRQHPEAAAAARRALAAAAGHGDSRGPSRASSPGRRRHSPPRGGSPGGSRRGRDWEERPPPRRGSPGPAGHYGSRGGGGSRAAEHSGGSTGDGGSAFWDPAHQLEERCLSLLQRRGPMSLSMLFGELGAVPPPCGPLNTGGIWGVSCAVVLWRVGRSRDWCGRLFACVMAGLLWQVTTGR